MKLTALRESGVFLAAISLMMLALPGLQAYKRNSPEEKRAKILEMSADTLNDLYRYQPGARNLIAKSAGVAVFSAKGMKIAVAGSDQGKGVLWDNSTGKKTYMKMAQVNVGLGFSLSDSRFVFIFQDKKAMEDFASMGWDFSGKLQAAATTKGQGAEMAGAISFMPGVMVYELTKNGLSAEITLSGTKFWVDKDLN